MWYIREKEETMDIQWSKRYICNRTEWIIDESTFQVLDEEKLVWAARVTTTHNSKYGQPEESFFALVRYTESFVLEDKNMPVLLDWLLKQQKG